MLGLGIFVIHKKEIKLPNILWPSVARRFAAEVKNEAKHCKIRVSVAKSIRILDVSIL